MQRSRHARERELETPRGSADGFLHSAEPGRANLACVRIPVASRVAIARCEPLHDTWDDRHAHAKTDERGLPC